MSTYLCCGVDLIPFRFIRMSVRATPRRKTTWHQLLVFRYGSLAANSLHRDASILTNGKASLWWHNLMKVGGMTDSSWFYLNISVG
jgi:hypothetical protein